MKRFFICFLAITALLSFDASAQDKGDKYVGGIVGVGLTSLEGNTSISAGLGFDFGYFAAKNLNIGAGVAYTIAAGDSVVHTLTLGPSLSYYVKLCDKFYYIPGLDLAFVYGNTDGINMPGFGVGLNLGSFEFRPTPHFGFAVNLLSFTYMYFSVEGYYGINGVNFNLGINPSAGLNYYF